VRAVWVSLRKAEGWAKDRLLLSTDPTLSAEAVIASSSRRWSIEPMFNSLKNAEGLKELGMRRRAVLLRWLHLVQLGYALLIMLAAKADPEVLALLRIPGWRKGCAITPGLVKDALSAAFRHCEPVRLLGWTPRKIRPTKLAHLAGSSLISSSPYICINKARILAYALPLADRCSGAPKAQGLTAAPRQAILLMLWVPT
jgi:hypothetical protein